MCFVIQSDFASIARSLCALALGIVGLGWTATASALPPLPPACLTNADCLPCDVCAGGQCLPTPGVPPECQVDADCFEPGTYCKAPEGAYCFNKCLPKGVECLVNEHCGGCAVCVQNECKGLGLVECSSDADCGNGEICFLHPWSSCKNECRSWSAPPACVADVDCPPCNVCKEGECVEQYTLKECLSDLDCAAGEFCAENPDGSCSLICIEKEDQCESDADCEPCGTCVNGGCVSLPSLSECASDDDCGDGFVCQPTADDACVLACVATADCVSDDDCGVCAVCVGGECKGLGLVACETDADCEPGYVCDLSPDAPCENVCRLADPACSTNEDCGECAQCVDGACAPVASQTCLTDADCPEDSACLPDPGDACSTQCVPNGAGDEGAGDEGDEGDEGAGDEGAGDEGSGDEGPGDGGAGDEGSSDEGAGDDGAGDEGTGDEGSGDEGTGDGGGGDDGGGCNAGAQGAGATLLALCTLALRRRRNRLAPS